MLASVIFLCIILFVPLAVIVGLYFIDRRLRGIDKPKFYKKSLQKQVKKGTLTEAEYQEQMDNLHLK